MPSKAELRRIMKKRIADLGTAGIRRRSERIISTFLTSPLCREAGAICLYVGISGEINTSPLIKELLDRKKTVVLPYCRDASHLGLARIRDTAQVQRGRFGIPEPQPSLRDNISRQELDLILVPGLAFDLQGNRLGRGGGYYDRFLAPPLRAWTAALACNLQIIHNIPVQKHDRPVEWIYAEDQSIRTRAERSGPF
ncbi:MAG: 5-formyltetrahydrofolate cyclo-ligase [Fibrobacterota bacterium]